MPEPLVKLDPVAKEEPAVSAIMAQDTDPPTIGALPIKPSRSSALKVTKVPASPFAPLPAADASVGCAALTVWVANALTSSARVPVMAPEPGNAIPLGSTFALQVPLASVTQLAGATFASPALLKLTVMPPVGTPLSNVVKTIGYAPLPE